MKREFLAEHGFEVIDAHIHPFLENEGANIAGFGSPASPDEFVAELKSLGIAKACGSVILRKDCRMEDIRDANRIALRLQIGGIEEFFQRFAHLRCRKAGTDSHIGVCV